MATLQVRAIDEMLYEALKRRASMENRSISQEVIAILKAHLSSPASKHTNNTNAFLEMCGTWQDDRSEEQIVDDIKKNRRAGERFREDLF